MSSTKIEGSPRERLLAAANQLFYEEGVHTVGIDRVIERAGVAKASLYSTFGSKDELVRAYLGARHEKRRAQILERVARFDEPRAKILGVFELLGELFADPTFRGCAFALASAESATGGKIQEARQMARAWVTELFTRLARDAGAVDPERLGRQLMLLYDGATMGASMDGDASRAADARAMASALLDAAVGATALAKGPRGRAARAGR